MVSERNYTRSKHTRVYELKFTHKSSSLDQIDQITQFFFSFLFFFVTMRKRSVRGKTLLLLRNVHWKCSKTV